MVEPLPFQELLERLRQERAVGVDDYLTLGRLLARSQGASIGELRDAIAALFGRDREGVARVREIFDELYGKLDAEELGTAALAADDTGMPAPPPEKRPPAIERAEPPPYASAFHKLRAQALDAAARGRAATYGGVVVAILVAGIVAWKVWPPEEKLSARVPPGWPIPTVMVSSSSTVDGLEPPVYQTMPGCESWTSPGINPWQWLTSGLVFVGLGLIAARASYLARGASVRRSVRRDRFAARAGKRSYDAGLASLSPRSFDTGLIRIAASLWEPRKRIDEARSVDETVRRGLLPVIVLGRRRGITRVLVIQETSPAAEAYQPHFDAFVLSLARQGMDVERLFFQDDLGIVRRSRVARSEPLLKVSRHATERPLIVLATGELALERARELEQLLEPWSARVLLTPLTDRTRVSPVLTGRGSPLPLFPLDNAGIRAASRVLEAGAVAIRGSAERRARILPTQVLRLRAMLSLAAAPTYAMAERLRARFLPLVPRDVLRAMTSVVREGSQGADATAALTWFREMDARPRAGRPAYAEETETRVFLTALLDEARPPLSSDLRDASLAELRWRRDRALQEVHSADPEVKERATRELAMLASSSLRAELDALDADNPASPAFKEVRAEIAKAADEPAPETSLLARLRWSVPTANHIGAAVLLAALASWGVGRLLDWRAGPLPLDGSSNLILTDTDLVQALCPFDSFGAGVRDAELGTYLIGTIPVPGDGTVKSGEGLDLPIKQIVVAHVQQGPLWSSVRMRRLGIKAPYGPDHMALKLTAERRVHVAVTMLGSDAENQSPARVFVLRPNFGVMTTEDSYASDVTSEAQGGGYFPRTQSSDQVGRGFEFYSPERRTFGPDGEQGNVAWARAVHRRDVNILSSGFLPGTPEQVITRLLNDNPDEPLPAVPNPWEGEPPVGLDGSGGGDVTQAPPNTKVKTVRWVSSANKGASLATATATCADQGLRLPTIAEINAVLAARSPTVPFFPDGVYWASGCSPVFAGFCANGTGGVMVRKMFVVQWINFGESTDVQLIHCVDDRKSAAE